MKKRSIIKRLLSDDPCSYESIRVDDEYWKKSDVISEMEKQLLEKIKGDADLIDLIKRYTDALDDLAIDESEAYFEMGVKFGVLFGMQLAED